MPRYLVSFDDSAMTFPEEELPDEAEAAHAVVREAMDAGVWVPLCSRCPRMPARPGCGQLIGRLGVVWAPVPQ